MTDMEIERVQRVASHFQYTGRLMQMEPYGSGHINDTYLLTYEIEHMGCISVILQRMNQKVFPNPEGLMENIIRVTRFLHDKIQAEGGDPYRETLNVIPARDGKPYYQETEEDAWRSYVFITDASCYDLVRSPEDFYESGRAFGHFQKLLSDFPASALHETIPDFHNTVKRLKDFKRAVAEDVADRVKLVQPEIDFVMEREPEAGIFMDLLHRGELPVRVTHNDTKLNNIMIDNRTRKGICIIDLDTTMPGLAMYDFGDAIRFGASTALEDEIDLDKVQCSMELFEVFTKGFLEGCDGRLTKKEIELLPMGAKIMTYECGMRFLADYLQNDIYFKISREHHNLDRARTQFKLVADMEAKWPQMQAIVAKYT